MMQDVSRDAWEYLAVCVPVVVIGAPLGSVIGSHFHRQVLAALIYLLDTIALVTAFCIVPQTPVLASVSVAIILVGFAFFYLLTVLGNRILKDIPADESPELDDQSSLDEDVDPDSCKLNQDSKHPGESTSLPM